MSEIKKLQIVLGGTSGMGLATAIALGKQGPVPVVSSIMRKIIADSGR